MDELIEFMEEARKREEDYEEMIRQAHAEIRRLHQIYRENVLDEEERQIVIAALNVQIHVEEKLMKATATENARKLRMEHIDKLQALISKVNYIGS